MKNLICPVSSELIPEHLPRITAFFTISLLLLFVTTGYIPLLVFLFLDFLLRGMNQSGYSLLSWLSKGTATILKLKSKMIDKAPKLFAARMGLVMTALALLAEFSGLHAGAIAIVSLVVVFSFLECVLNFCVACYIYTFVVFPFYFK